MLTSSYLATLLLLGSIFDVRPTSGPPIRGELTRLDEKSLVITAKDGEKTLPLREVSRVTRVDVAPKTNFAPLPIMLHLVDGTTWKLASLKLEAGRLEVKDASGAAANPRLRAAAAMRLRANEGSLDAAWEEYLKAKRETDSLIVRRTVNRKAEDGETVISSEVTLDEIEGKLADISDASVKFEIEGEVVAITRDRVEGVVLAVPNGADMPEMTCLAVDTAGSRWKLQSLLLERGVLKLTSVSGVATDLPLEQLTALDFSASNTRYLSDLEMAASETHPYLDASFTGAKLAKLLAPRKDQGFFGGKMEGGDSPFGDAKGISLVAYSKVQYRVPKGFTRFGATAALDPRVKKVGGVMLRIQADDRELLSKLIDGSQAGEAIDIELPAQARMLTIEADFGPRKELGASLQLRGARFSK